MEMGLFGKKEQVRGDAVLKLVSLEMREADELMDGRKGRDFTPSAKTERARLEAWRRCTPAERKAAGEALRRHGYGDRV